jgi:hypothetical protein
MSPIVTASLVTGDYDVPAATGFVLVHKPIDPANIARPATGGGYFEGSSSGVPVQWAYPPTNWQDQLKGFDIQVGLAATPFTDTLPTPFFHQPNGDPAYTFYGTNGVLYRFRVRAVYEDGSKGPWMDNAPVPTLPANNEVVFPGTAAGQITFGWNAVVPSTYSGTLKYVVQYSNSPTFAVASLLPATTGLTATTTVAPLIGTTYYWRVKVQNPTGVDISDWSRTQMFFNRYKNINNGPTYQWDDFGQSPNPIRFFAASTNATLPVNAYYQVELSNDGYTADSHLFTFTKTATLATPSARQFLDGMLSDTYNWRIRIVNGNDDNAAPITDWTSGTGTIVIP